MSNPFGIIKDSSLWQSNSTVAAINNKDSYIRIGIVKRAYKDVRSTDLRYLVEVQDTNNSIEVNARMLRRFGGVYNYEDVVYRGYKIDDKPDPVSNFDAKAGDTVIVAFLNGESREAIILGGFFHPARTSVIDITKGPQLISEFNGIEKVINDSGEYKVTFKAIPTNIATLNEVPDKVLPKPTYNTKIGGSFYKFDKTGSYEVSDVEQSGIQNFKINKPSGTIEINSGKIRLIMTKKDESVKLTCKVLSVVSETSITNKTKEFGVDAETSIKLKSAKIAIGKDGVELLDQLSQLVDKLGKVAPISPIGPCTPLMSTPEWSDVTAIQSKIKEITGGL